MSASADVRRSMTGYEYVMALTNGIEAWVADNIRRDPNAFVYRNSDFRFAVARALYFLCADSRELVEWFSGNALPPPATLHPYVRMVAPYVGRDVVPFDAGQKRAQPRLAWARNVLRLVCRHAVPFSITRNPPHIAPEVLFLVIHPKFVRFLAPLVEKLGARAAFLTVDNEITREFLEERDIPAVHLKRNGGGVSPAGAVQDFGVLCDQYDLLRSFFSGAAFRTLVVVEGNAPVCEVARLAAASVAKSSVCIQYGWSPVSHPGFRGLMFDKMLVWGRLFGELLAGFSPRQTFVPAGSLEAIETLRSPPRQGKIKTIGFFLQKGGALIGPDNWADFLSLIRWVAENLPVTVVVRQHPSAATLDDNELALIGDHANLKFSLTTEQPLAAALAECDVAVAAYSTILLEAIAAGAIPVIFGASIPHFWPDIASMGAAIEDHSLEGTKAKLSALVSDLAYCAGLRVQGAALRPRLFAAAGDEAIERIASEISTPV
jgi:hypothetical protein